MLIKELAKKYKTPFYLYDVAAFTKRYLSIKEAFKARKSLIFYAVKANSNINILKELSKLGSGFDCVSINEIKRALKAGAKPYKIIFSGVGKSAHELEFALEQKILFINIESEAEFELLEKIANKKNMIANISIRVNPNVDAKTHPYISTGLKKNKFGVCIAEARKLYLRAHKSSFLNPIGIHFHIGSQLLDISPILEAANIVAKLVSELNAAGLKIKFFDVGGGLGVGYEDEIEPSLYEYAQGILAALRTQELTICLEPGRYIMAKAGVLVAGVLYEKINEGRRFVIVDAAMSDLARPALYNAHHKIELLSDDDGEASLCDVVGGVCESGDFLAKARALKPCKSGDLIVIKDTGAYGFSMSSNYNSRDKCAELMIKDGTTSLIRKRESLDHQLCLEEF